MFFISTICAVNLYLSSNRGCRWCTTDDFTTSFVHFSLFSASLWDLANSTPVHSQIMSSYFSVCLPCLLPPSIVSCKMVWARPDERETCPDHFSLRLFAMVKRSSCGPIACWILAQTSSLITWSLYEMRCAVNHCRLSNLKKKKVGNRVDCQRSEKKIENT